MDLTIVAGRRPELLWRTLDSFFGRFFCHSKIGNVFINIDPVFGGPKSHRKCISMALEYFPKAVIFEPESASFCGAVKRVWESTSSDVVFHLEDDWILLEKINLPQVCTWIQATRGPDSRTKAVSLLSASHGRKGGRDFSEILTTRRVFGGLAYRREWISAFNTSPSFFCGRFLRRVAELLETDLDPEKQMRPPFNPRLHSFLSCNRCRFLKSANGSPIIEDIGREWLKAKGIMKETVDGVSRWQRVC